MGHRGEGAGHRGEGCEGAGHRGEGAGHRGEGARARGIGDRAWGIGERARGHRGEGAGHRGEGAGHRGEGARVRGLGERVRTRTYSVFGVEDVGGGGSYPGSAFCAALGPAGSGPSRSSPGGRRTTRGRAAPETHRSDPAGPSPGLRTGAARGGGGAGGGGGGVRHYSMGSARKSIRDAG